MAQRVVDHSISPEELERMEKEEKNASKKGTKGQAEDNKTASEAKSKKKSSHKQKKQRGKKYKEARKSIDKKKSHSITEALEVLKKIKFANFDESVELHINLGIDPKNSNQRVRFSTSLPFNTGKTARVLVVSDKKTKKEKNIIYKDESVVDEIQKGKLKPDADFDIVVCHPSKMKDLAKVAKILGPKGMMPSPKNGTVTDKIDDVLKDLSKGQIEIKNQSNHAVIHVVIGKISSKVEGLEANIKHVLDELVKNSPSKLKKKLIQSAYICTSMSPSVRLEV